MKFSLRYILQYFILFTIGIGLLYLAFRGQNLNRIWSEIKTANLFWVSVSAFTVLIAHFLRSLRWKMLFGSIHYKVRLSSAYHAVIIGYLTNLALPRAGEITRCSAIQKTEKVPFYASVGTVITERLFDSLCLLISGLIMLIFQYRLVGTFLYNYIYLNLIRKLYALNHWWLAILCLCFIFLSISFFYFIRKKIGRSGLKIIAGLRQGFLSYYKLKQKSVFLAYTAGIWLFYYFSMYLAFFSLEQTNHLGFNAAFTCLVFSGLAMAAPVQGGIGVFHWMVSQALSLYALEFDDGLTYATIIHSSQVLLTLILGCISLTWVLTRKNQKSH